MLNDSQRTHYYDKVLSNFVIDLIKMDIPILKEIQEILKDDEDGFAYRLKKEEVLSKTEEIEPFSMQNPIDGDATYRKK